MNAVRRRPLVLVLGALLVAAGCSDSTSPVDRGAALTAEERTELAMQMGALFGRGLTQLSTLPDRAGDASLSVVPAPFSVSFTATVPCPKGGSTRLSVTIDGTVDEDRKSTRLNSSHANISYAVFCLKKK